MRNAVAHMALFLSGAISAGYGLFLIVLGQPWATITEAGESAPAMIPAAAGVVPLVAGVLVIAGAAFHRKLIAFVGAALLLAFAILFIFGIGGVMVPVAVLSLIATAATRYRSTNRAHSASS
jgi:hypothetical protein